MLHKPRHRIRLRCIQQSLPQLQRETWALLVTGLVRLAPLRQRLQIRVVQTSGPPCLSSVFGLSLLSERVRQASAAVVMLESEPTIAARAMFGVCSVM